MLTRSVSFLKCLLPLVLACLYPVLSAWSRNHAELSLSMLPRTLSLALAAGGGIVVLLLPLFHRKPARLSVVATLLILLFFSNDLLANYLVPFVEQSLELVAISLSSGVSATTADVILALCALAIVGVGFRSPRPVERLLPGLTILTLTQVLLCTPALFRSRATPAPSTVSSSRPLPATSAATSNPLPDLYCIVLDAYGRQDVLQRLFGVDNTAFVEALEARGFFVARKSRANYLQTPLALAAALNYDYLPPLLPRSPEADAASGLLDRNRIASLLRDKGFQYVSVPTGIAQTALASADLTLDQFDGPRARLTPLDQLVLNKTPLYRLLNTEQSAFDEHRSRLLSAFKTNLPAAAALPFPKFVVAHILAPHPPFVFGPHGEPRTPQRTSFTLGDATDYSRRYQDNDYKDRYADQLRYTNQLLLECLDRVRQNQKRPAVIVVMGDHGSRMGTDWQSLERTDLTEPFANLMAVSTPDRKAGTLLTDSVSPVNVFRLLLSAYYDQRLPRLPDRSYYSTLQEPFRFTDVTDRTG